MAVGVVCAYVGMFVRGTPTHNTAPHVSNRLPRRHTNTGILRARGYLNLFWPKTNLLRPMVWDSTY